MRYFIILLISLALAAPAIAFDLDTEVQIAASKGVRTNYREAFVQEADKNVRLSAENADLRAEVDHLTEGEKFYWFVIGAFIYQGIRQ